MAQASDTQRGALSPAERDRRYTRIREQLREKGADCLIVGASNLFYLTNGISGERYGLLPTSELPMTVGVSGRHLADIPAHTILDEQDWIEDIRPAWPGNDAAPLIERINELHLQKGVIGVARPISLEVYQRLAKEFPDARLLDVSEVLTNVRTIKSAEEVALIEQANQIFDAGVRGMHENVRPGMTGAEAAQAGIVAMWRAGGDLDSTLSFNFGAVAKQNPAIADLCLSRPIQWGDIGTVTAHSEYQHYAGHSDQEMTFGEPSELYKDMFAAVLEVREAVLKHVRPGATQRDLIDAYQRACAQTKFQSSPHSQIHQYGIDVPEFPGPRFRIPDSGDGRGLGSAGNFTLAPGMIYSISPTLVAPRKEEDTVLGGTSLVVTEDGYRELSDRKVEMLVVA